MLCSKKRNDSDPRGFACIKIELHTWYVVLLNALKNWAYPSAAGAQGPANPPSVGDPPSPEPNKRAGTPKSTEWSVEHSEVAGSLGRCTHGGFE